MSKRLLVEQKHTKAGIEFIKEGLEEFGIEKKQTIKTMLLVEEVLVKLREHAKDPDENMLITTSLPVSLIAAKVGYDNFSHFSKVYKKVMGTTPSSERNA